MKRVLILCTTDSMIWNFLIPHIEKMKEKNMIVECACSKTGIYYDELIKKYGLQVFSLPFHRSPYSIDNFKAYKKVIKLVENRKYDTIFCHEPVGGAIGRLAGRKCHVKVIYMAHGFHFYKGAPIRNWIIYYSVERLLAKYTDALITINSEDYEVAKSFKAKKVVLLNGIGVDLNRFKRSESNYLREKFKLKEKDCILLSVGELINRKNHKVIIDTLIKMKNPNIHYFIAGTGELESYLKSLVKKNSLEKNIHFLGFCRNISELCNACDIFVFPSVQEGLSMALMEAMACGKPIIASRIRGNIDLITDKESGILVDTFDVEGYAKALIYLMSNREKWNDIAKYNMKKVGLYSIDKVSNQLQLELEKI